MIAQVIYWYPLTEGPGDGGQQRARAWQRALAAYGMDVVVTSIHPDAPSGSDHASSRVRRLKQATFPMPFPRDHAVLAQADVVVATVPAVFESVLRRANRHQLVIFDWMDLWSAASESYRGQGAAGLGGCLQGARWRRRERTLAQSRVTHTFAGYGDALGLKGSEGARHWLPTPVTSTSLPRGSSVVTPSKLGFIGNLQYKPNRIALDWFLARYSQELASSGRSLVIAGRGSDAEELRCPSVRGLGAVQAVEDFYSQIDAAIVPVHVGGGIKVKAVEAMSHGIPVYATPHVRSGFSPDFAPFIGDVEGLFSTGSVTISTVPERLFASTLTQDAFNRQVHSILDRIPDR